MDPQFKGKESLPRFHLSKKVESLFSLVFWLSTTRYGFTRFGAQIQPTQVSTAVTYLARTYIPDCVLWLRGHNGVAPIGKMHDQDFVTITSGIESLDCVTSFPGERKLASLRLRWIHSSDPRFRGKESRPPSASDRSALWLSLPWEGKSASLRLRRIDPLTVAFGGRRFGLPLPQMDRPFGCRFLGRRVGPYTFTAAVTSPQMDRPFSRNFHGKRSRPRCVSDWSTPWPSLSREEKSASLRLGWLASLDPHFPPDTRPPSASVGSPRRTLASQGRQVSLPPPRMDRLVGPSLHGEGRCLASI